MMDRGCKFGDVRLPLRFWIKVSQEPTGCWHFNGARDRSGYGRFRWQRPYALAHRVIYTELVGVIPPGWHVDHLCRNRACCNPDHLEAVTPQENVSRSTGFGPSNKLLTHCPRNHPYLGDNLYINSRGARCCRECIRISRMRNYAYRGRYIPRFCPNGHEYTPENTMRVGKEKARRCRTCRTPQIKASQAKYVTGEGSGSAMRAKTHCPRGHPYSGDNLIVRKRAEGRQSRVCRSCTQERDRIRRQKPPTARKG